VHVNNFGARVCSGEAVGDHLLDRRWYARLPFTPPRAASIQIFLMLSPPSLQAVQMILPQPRARSYRTLDGRL